MAVCRAAAHQRHLHRPGLGQGAGRPAARGAAARGPRRPSAPRRRRARRGPARRAVAVQTSRTPSAAGCAWWSPPGVPASTTSPWPSRRRAWWASGVTSSSGSPSTPRGRGRPRREGGTAGRWGGAAAGLPSGGWSVTAHGARAWPSSSSPSTRRGRCRLAAAWGARPRGHRPRGSAGRRRPRRPLRPRRRRGRAGRRPGDHRGRALAGAGLLLAAGRHRPGPGVHDRRRRGARAACSPACAPEGSSAGWPAPVSRSSCPPTRRHGTAAVRRPGARRRRVARLDLGGRGRTSAGGSRARAGPDSLRGRPTCTAAGPGRPGPPGLRGPPAGRAHRQRLRRRGVAAPRPLARGLLRRRRRSTCGSQCVVGGHGTSHCSPSSTAGRMPWCVTSRTRPRDVGLAAGAGRRRGGRGPRAHGSGCGPAHAPSELERSRAEALEAERARGARRRRPSRTSGRRSPSSGLRQPARERSLGPGRPPRVGRAAGHGLPRSRWRPGWTMPGSRLERPRPCMSTPQHAALPPAPNGGAGGPCTSTNRGATGPATAGRRATLHALAANAHSKDEACSILSTYMRQPGREDSDGAYVHHCRRSHRANTPHRPSRKCHRRDRGSRSHPATAPPARTHLFCRSPLAACAPTKPHSGPSPTRTAGPRQRDAGL